MKDHVQNEVGIQDLSGSCETGMEDEENHFVSSPIMETRAAGSPSEDDAREKRYQKQKKKRRAQDVNCEEASPTATSYVQSEDVQHTVRLCRSGRLENLNGHRSSVPDQLRNPADQEKEKHGQTSYQHNSTEGKEKAERPIVRIPISDCSGIGKIQKQGHLTHVVQSTPEKSMLQKQSNHIIILDDDDDDDAFKGDEIQVDGTCLSQTSPVQTKGKGQIHHMYRFEKASSTSSGEIRETKIQKLSSSSNVGPEASPMPCIPKTELLCHDQEDEGIQLLPIEKNIRERNISPSASQPSHPRLVGRRLTSRTPVVQGKDVNQEQESRASDANAATISAGDALKRGIPSIVQPLSSATSPNVAGKTAGGATSSLSNRLENFRNWGALVNEANVYAISADHEAQEIAVDADLKLNVPRMRTILAEVVINTAYLPRLLKIRLSRPETFKSVLELPVFSRGRALDELGCLLELMHDKVLETTSESDIKHFFARLMWLNDLSSGFLDLGWLRSCLDQIHASYLVKQKLSTYDEVDLEIASFKAKLVEQRKALDLVKDLEQLVQIAEVQRAHIAVQRAYDEVQRAHDEAAQKKLTLGQELEQLAQIAAEAESNTPLDELH